MNIKGYLGDLIGGSLMIAESRIIAEFLLKKLSDEDWKKLIIEQNILQKKSGQTAIRYARTIRWRLEPLGEAYLKALLEADERAYLQLLMVALLIHSPVVADFMRMSLADARRTYMPTLPLDAWMEFFDTRIRAVPELGMFSESTIKKMGTNTVKALVDCGYLSSSRGRQIQPVYLLSEVKSWLNLLGCSDRIEVMECTI